MLLTDECLGIQEIKRYTGKSKACVWRWQECFITGGVDGLLRDKTRLPGNTPIPGVVVAAIIEKTLHETPPKDIHWAVCIMAKLMGISVSTAQKIWRARGLAMHRNRHFKFSNDVVFVNKLQDAGGLYASPPTQSVLLSMGEKS